MLDSLRGLDVDWLLEPAGEVRGSHHLTTFYFVSVLILVHLVASRQSPVA